MGASLALLVHFEHCMHGSTTGTAVRCTVLYSTTLCIDLLLLVVHVPVHVPIVLPVLDLLHVGYPTGRGQS